RLELWLKKKSKPLTRWFTWEQVNFNHAVNEALGDVVEILKAEAHELAAMRAQLTHELHLVRSQAADQTREIQDLGRKHDEALSETQSANTRVTQLLDKLKDDSAVRLEHLLSEHARLQAEHTSLVAEHSQLANQVIELAAQLRAEDQDIQSQQSQEINRRLDELAAELKDEQRVCFRQISLETSEAAVLEERARRGVLTRLEQLERSLKD
ncbi:MAG TPA: hypothetical protein VE961_28235, partial [Pyrinomonadaceae bacterium]|nr:hypothetical protein [Pyrinomonadaceae bacterium]